MVFGNTLSSYALPVSWILLILVLTYLPKIVRRSKLGNVITDSMVTTTKSVIIAYLIISVVTVFSTYLVAYLTGLLFIGTR